MASSILAWLMGKKKRTELPTYSELRSVRTRALPSELKDKEASIVFSTGRDALRQELLLPHRRPAADATLFTELVSSVRHGVVTFALPKGGRCLPVFTTPFRASDYREVLVDGDPTMGYLVSTPAGLLKMLRDIEKVGIETLALDRCPRCPTFTAISTSSLKSVDDLVTVWSISKSTELARLELYAAHARELARAGHLTLAKDVALETVGHINWEDPRLHLLLGELGVALGEPTLTREATGCLRFLKLDRWERKLQEVVESGAANFELPV
jgi:hypothetical protein